MEYQSKKSNEKCHNTSDSSDFTSYDNGENEAENESEYLVRRLLIKQITIRSLKVFSFLNSDIALWQFQEEIWFSDCEDDREKIVDEIVINDDIYEALISGEVSSITV